MSATDAASDLKRSYPYNLDPGIQLGHQNLRLAFQ